MFIAFKIFYICYGVVFYSRFCLKIEVGVTSLLMLIIIVLYIYIYIYRLNSIMMECKTHILYIYIYIIVKE